MRILGHLKGRIIYPPSGENEKAELSAGRYRSRTVQLVEKAYQRARFVARMRVRVTSNVSSPLLALVSAPLVVALLVAYLLLGGSAGGGILPMKNKGLPPVREIKGDIDRPFVVGCRDPDPSGPRANGVLVVLARNSEVEGITTSMKSLERHFNRWYHYPYVFLNDEPFNSTFIEAVSNVTDSKVEFGVIDGADWNFPTWAEEEYVAEAIARQGDQGIMYGAMESYHKMCRFYSGKFYKHPLLAKYEWYWRLEPDVKFFCDLTYDPFKYMERNNKVYGFTIIIKELVETVPNLFRHTVGFKKSQGLNTTQTWNLFLAHPDDEDDQSESSRDSASVKARKKQQKQEEEQQRVKEHAELKEQLPEEAFLEKEQRITYGGMPSSKLSREWEQDGIHPNAMDGEVYNMCHFWSNFEIARLDFFRSKQYNDYFEALERAGGFWTERWGDAPVHSLAAGLFLEPSQLHYFRDIGYRHTTIQHCPANAPQRQKPHLPYIRDPSDPEQVKEDAYWADFDPEVPNGVGCRCRCDTDVTEIEGKPGSCLSRWVDVVGGWI
ncbi:probable mannosyltransferase Ktr5p [Trichomonascus vanleenenianus]|uniref:glycosyltransferase family 15 protein n=1 Tax=Trichomonascus vanleenenianus TaxID=2268995 RepID=UPI003ECA0D5C